MVVFSLQYDRYYKYMVQTMNTIPIYFSMCFIFFVTVCLHILNATDSDPILYPYLSHGASADHICKNICISLYKHCPSMFDRILTLFTWVWLTPILVCQNKLKTIRWSESFSQVWMNNEKMLSTAESMNPPKTIKKSEPSKMNMEYQKHHHIWCLFFHDRH